MTKVNKPLVRVGILGTGFIAAYHFDCMKRVHGVDVEVIGVFDIVKEKAEKFAEERGIYAFDDQDKLFSQVDAVDICTPPFTHAENIINISNARKNIFCEKPLIGYAPSKEDEENFKGNSAPKLEMLHQVLEKMKAIKKSVIENEIKFVYFENFVYTPQVQKEAEIIRKTKAQILRMIGEESHKGNHAAYSSWWKYACGGSLISTGSHPLGAVLFLKRVEGIANYQKPISPMAVSSRVHELTKIDNFRDDGFIRANYHDVEDYAWSHVVFEDGTVGDIVAGATTLGGINDYVDVFTNNHRTRCNINPVGLIQTYNPKANQYKDIYINYGISTQEGWLYAAPDENWMFGYQAEMQDAIECIAFDREPISNLELGIDTINVIYSSYLSAERLGCEVKLERI